MKMLKRMMIVCAALVLFTGVAATAHAGDHFKVINNTGKPVGLAAFGIKIDPQQTLRTHVTATIEDKRGGFNLEERYHLEKLWARFRGGEIVAYKRHAVATDPNRNWIVILYMEQGQLKMGVQEATRAN